MVKRTGVEMNKMIIYGDSLSTGTHGNGGYLEAVRMALHIKEIENHAVGSSGLCEGTPNHMLGILQSQVGKTEGMGADLVLVWHGSNDWYWGVEQMAFREAIPRAVHCVRQRNPQALLVWATPIFRYETPHQGKICGNGFFTENAVGNTLEEYAQSIRQMGKRLGFPVIEMGISVGIHAENEKHYLEDHVHPNAEGYQKIARVLTAEIEKYLYFIRGEKGHEGHWNPCR